MSFFEELKRRNVVRVAIAYVLISWVLLQAADFFLDVIDAPNWVIQALLMVALLGLIGVVIFSWVFEMTPEGIKREQDIDRSQSITQQTGRKLDRTIIVFLVFVIGWFVFDQYYPGRQTPDPTSIDEARNASTTLPEQNPEQESSPSIAVLPFVNMSNDSDNEYFSDGLTETLLHMLAQLPELKVAARTSSFAFKGKNASITEIADALSVAHVLEGSVQKAGDRVRVTAQLIRASDGFHVWSQNYTRPLEDIFAIQDEIATDVVGALDDSLLGGDQKQLVGIHTDDLAAYESWLKGLEEQGRYSYVSLPLAENHFKQALARDPDFDEARLSLVRNYISSNSTGLIDQATMESSVQPLLAQVRANDPDNTVARILELTVKLNSSYRLGSETVRPILNELRDLLTIAPAETLSRRFVASTLNRFFNEQEESIQVLKAGLLIDPLAAGLHANLGAVYKDNDQYDEARAAGLRSLELEPGNPNFYWDLYELELELNNLPVALEWARQAIEVDPQDHELAYQLARLMYRLNLPEEGNRWNARVQALAPGSGAARSIEVEHALARNDKEQAIELAWQAVADRIDNRQGAFRTSLNIYMDLMAAAGRSEQAYDALAEQFPGITSYGQPMSSLKDFSVQWASVMLMSDFAPPQERRQAWNQMIALFSQMDFPWDDPDGDGVWMNLAFNDETEAAIKAMLEGPLNQPLTNNLYLLQRSQESYAPEIYSDTRVVARIAEIRRDSEQARTDVQEMLAQPEWQD